MVASKFAKTADALKGRARLAKIDTEQFPQVAQNLQIRGIALLILYAKGGEVDRLSGPRPANDMEALVRQHL